MPVIQGSEAVVTTQTCGVQQQLRQCFSFAEPAASSRWIHNGLKFEEFRNPESSYRLL